MYYKYYIISFKKNNKSNNFVFSPLIFILGLFIFDKQYNYVYIM